MKRFRDLIGQELASTILMRAIREDKITHAYLFTGPEGVGKKTTALAFAAALNCENLPESGDSCGECVQCRMIGGDGHADIEIISPDGAETKIKQMREMRRSAQYAPVRGRRKVVIIEQADTMNEDSSSAILKILEEPPQYLVMILLSRNPAILLPTIRSRCLQVRFPNVSVEKLADALMNGYSVDKERAEFLAAYSEGRPGKAISIMEDEGFNSWRAEIGKLASGISASSTRSALRLSEDLQKLASQGKEDGQSQRAAMKTVLDALVLWYRDVLGLSVQGQSARLINSDLRELLTSLPASPDRASAAIETLLWAERAIEGNANVQLISDVVMIRLLS